MSEAKVYKEARPVQLCMSLGAAGFEWTREAKLYSQLRLWLVQVAGFGERGDERMGGGQFKM